MIDPNFWQSEDVSKLTIRQRLLLIGLFSNADDEGKLRGNPAFIRSIVFPYEDFTSKEIETDLEAIESIGTIKIYEVNGSRYIKLKNWRKFQRVEKPQPSMIPDPDDEQFSDESENDSWNDSRNGSWNEYENDSRLKEKKRKEEKENNIPFSEIIDYLNLKTNSKYKPTTKATRDKIKARWREGYTLEDFKTVIDKKVAEWINDPKMAQYLRPETLFGTKFESYLNQPIVLSGGKTEQEKQEKRPTTSDIPDSVAKVMARMRGE
jgi:uncharacterized phage protein (TIGR02220 family)